MKAFVSNSGQALIETLIWLVVLFGTFLGIAQNLFQAWKQIECQREVFETTLSFRSNNHNMFSLTRLQKTESHFVGTKECPLGTAQVRLPKLQKQEP